MQRKTNKQKQIQGTQEKSRIPSMPFKLLTEIPAPFEPLDEAGERYFNYMCQVLIDNGLLTAAWIPDITAAAWLYSLYIENKNLVDKLGSIQEAQSGYRQKAPELVNAISILEHLKRLFLKNYGLTPVDMEKVPKMKEDEQKSLDDLVNG